MNHAHDPDRPFDVMIDLAHPDARDILINKVKFPSIREDRYRHERLKSAHNDLCELFDVWEKQKNNPGYIIVLEWYREEICELLLLVEIEEDEISNETIISSRQEYDTEEDDIQEQNDAIEYRSDESTIENDDEEPTRETLQEYQRKALNNEYLSREEYEELIRDLLETAEAWLIKLTMEDGKWIPVFEVCFSKAIEIYPNSSSLYAAAGYYYFYYDDLIQARNFYKKANSLGIIDEDTRDLGLDIMVKSNQYDLLIPYIKDNYSFDISKYDIDEYDELARLYWLLWTAYNDLGNIDLTEKYFNSMLDTVDIYMKSYVQHEDEKIINIVRQSAYSVFSYYGNNNIWIQLLEDRLILNPDLIYYIPYLADMLYEKQKYAKAHPYYKKTDDRARLWNCYSHMWKWNQAYKAYEEAIDWDQQSKDLDIDIYHSCWIALYNCDDLSPHEKAQHLVSLCENTISFSDVEEEKTLWWYRLMDTYREYDIADQYSVASDWRQNLAYQHLEWSEYPDAEYIILACTQALSWDKPNNKVLKKIFYRAISLAKENEEWELALAWMNAYNLYFNQDEKIKQDKSIEQEFKMVGKKATKDKFRNLIIRKDKI